MYLVSGLGFKLLSTLLINAVQMYCLITLENSSLFLEFSTLYHQNVLIS